MIKARIGKEGQIWSKKDCEEVARLFEENSELRTKLAEAEAELTKMKAFGGFDRAKLAQITGSVVIMIDRGEIKSIVVEDGKVTISKVEPE